MASFLEFTASYQYFCYICFMEIWKNISGFELKYQVSNLGRVKSLERTVNRGGRLCLPVKEKILTPMTSRKGYKSVRLYSEDGFKNITVHKVVAEEWMDYKPEAGMVIDHIDNDKSNNSVSNLQVITDRENVSKDRKNKTSIYQGVCLYKPTMKWRSSICINRKAMNLGYFETQEQAATMYRLALSKTHLFEGDVKKFKRTLLV